MQELQLVLFRDQVGALSKLYSTDNAALWRIFLLDNQSLNKINTAFA